MPRELHHVRSYRLLKPPPFTVTFPSVIYDLRQSTYSTTMVRPNQKLSSSHL